MQRFDPGHQESHLDLPDPLEASSPWALGPWALPNAGLSWASAMAFFAVLTFLLASPERRALFTSPIPPLIPGVFSSAGAWLLAFACRKRPGRRLPRLWLLALGFLTSTITLGTLLQPSFIEKPILHALSIAGAAAVLVLLPRLLKVPPDSFFIQRLAPLALLGVLLTVLPSACWLGNHSVRQQEKQIEATTLGWRQLAEEVRAVAEFDWADIAVRPEVAAGRVERLAALSFDKKLSSASLWEAAEVLGKGEALRVAAVDLADAVADGLKPEKAPRLSRLVDPAVRWDSEENRWIPNPRFPSASRTTAQYHRHLSRLLFDLETQQASLEGLGETKLVEQLRSKTQVSRDYLTGLRDSWADGWVLDQVLPTTESVFEARTLGDVLGASVGILKGEPLTAVAFARWMKLRSQEVSALVSQLPGCRAPRYHENGREYLRLDCYAYASSPEGPGAQLLVEVRVVWASPRGEERLSPRAQPVEIFYLFPTPKGQRPAAYQEAIMMELLTAVRSDCACRVSPIDRGGAPSSGFHLTEGGLDLTVSRATNKRFVGETRAIQVRVKKRS